MLLEGKVAIVTGSAQGIGKAYARRLVKEGAKVVVADIAYERAEETAAEIRAAGGDAIAVKVDVSNEASALAMARQAVEKYGKIDILVNNAALFAALFPKKYFTDISEEEWDRVMAVNVKGVFFCCKAVFPYMKAQGKGKIINISSSTFWHGSVDFLQYVTSKGAVIGLTRQLAREVGDYGINVNCITPGLTASEGVERAYQADYLELYAKKRCFKRLERPEDLVGTVVFLASEMSDFMTGQTINVDGGDVLH